MENTTLLHCEQCYRADIELDSNCLRSRNLRTRVKFCNLVDRRKETNRIAATALPRLCLCDLCKIYLYKTDGQSSLDEWAVQWPSIIWAYLSSANVCASDTFTTYVWSMLPETWRKWWYHSARTYIKYRKERRYFYPYENMEIKTPMPYLVDLTEQFLNAGKVESSLHISSLLQYFDNCCFANVKCPWGCHEFLGDCGMVSYENVLFHFADEYIKCKEFLRAGKDLYFADNLLGCRRDFLILPTISDFANCVRGVVITEKNGPMVLTCRAHHNGT